MSDLIQRHERRIFLVQDSTAISEVAYSVNEQRLSIKFINGNFAVHENVPVGIYKDLLKAKSVGTYYNLHVEGIYEISEQS